MNLEFEVDGKKYKSGDLDVFKQQAIVKRLAPLLGSLGELRKFVVMGPDNKPQAADIVGVMATILNALTKMEDTDLEFIQKTCLLVTSRQQEGGVWARVYVQGGIIAFSDIGLLELNEIVFNILKGNLSDFISGLARRGWTGPQSQ